MTEPVVVTSCGHLRGSIEKSVEGFEYYAFKGVPYAKPPIGELRFQDPQPPEAWVGTRDATIFGSPCAQFDQFKQSYVGSDDCLYLNIYVKSITPNLNLPVMMWIHGGAFSFGSGDDELYGPDYLLRKDIVLVTINYRLGVFGFLNLEDEIMPGNQGMKDQVMALRWIQQNIAIYGGDPNNVTLFGESSGAACVHYLALSPMTKGLLHKIICQSGVAINTWASLPNPKQYAYALCKTLGYETNKSEEIVKYLRTIDHFKLVKMQEKLRSIEEKMQLLYPFGPAMDVKSANPFMPIPISEAIQRGLNIPVLLGYNNREGIYSLATLQNAKMRDVDKNFNNYMHPNLLSFLQKNNLTSYNLREIYNCAQLTEQNYSNKLIDLMGDMYISLGCHITIKFLILQNLAPIYFYKFSYDKGLSLTKLMVQTSLKGASHFDEVPYLFYMRYFDTLGIDHLQRGTNSYKVMEQMIEMWTNFAKNGMPTSTISNLISEKWTRVTNPIHLSYMNIDTKLSMNNTINIEQHLCSG
ncbi:PREDICTED: esterase FE4-like [Ceratosolen solmsi marchali]|uniref:Esterase FE4-like n=1 Tax=Ceratosolen solmsi marchali TaxID=326594 RepID=A0AAJ7DSX8_9HYME|nr:PREDICTED: esterase FE4-like [Ceratosolen solmsi marchali]